MWFVIKVISRSNLYVNGLLISFSIFFAYSSDLFAVKYLDLDSGSIIDSDPKSTPHTKNVVSLGKDMKLPSGFQKQTKEFIRREQALREVHDIAESLNVAQFSFYGIYHDQECKVVEDMPNPQCKAVFYMSGNKPYPFPDNGNPKKKAVGIVDVRSVKLGKTGFGRAIQRTQPILLSMETTTMYLEELNNHVENVPSSNELVKQATLKSKGFSGFRTQQKEVIQGLKTMVEQMKLFSRNTQNSFLNSFKEFSEDFLCEVIASIAIDDFNFVLLNGARDVSSMKNFIEKIQQSLSQQQLTDLLNSKHFNLACSEQLLLYSFSSDVTRSKLSTKLKDLKKKEGLSSIWLQIHSTKAPCKACLIGCCGHLNNGWIKELFDKITKSIEVPVNLVISYKDKYEDNYGFSVPIANDLSEINGKMLLVNAQDFLQEETNGAPIEIDSSGFINRGEDNSIEYYLALKRMDSLNENNVLEEKSK